VKSAAEVPTITTDKSTYTVGENILVTWNNPGTTYVVDWVTYAPQGTTWSSSTFPAGHPKFNTDGAHNWTKPLVPATAGTFDVIYYTQPPTGGKVLMRSAPIVVKPAYFHLGSDKAVYYAGETISVTWNNPYTSQAKDWLTVVPFGAQYTSATWPTGVLPKTYTGGTANGTKTFLAPSVPGTYELAYYVNDTFTELARATSTITVTSSQSQSVNVSPSSVQQNQNLSVSWNFPQAPANSAVALWLVRSDGTAYGLIEGNKTASGNVTWPVPLPKCDSSGSCRVLVDSPAAYYTDPGNYNVVANLYTPQGAYLGGYAPPSPVYPMYLATTTSSVFTIATP
jgi:hypothetical protein